MAREGAGSLHAHTQFGAAHAPPLGPIFDLAILIEIDTALVGSLANVCIVRHRAPPYVGTHAHINKFRLAGRSMSYSFNARLTRRAAKMTILDRTNAFEATQLSVSRNTQRDG
jgi:hypothetical protein